MWILISCGYLAIVLNCNLSSNYFLINERIHSCKPFLHCFILQLLSKLCDLSCELCVGTQIYVLNLILKDKSSTWVILIYISIWIYVLKFILHPMQLVGWQPNAWSYPSITSRKNSINGCESDILMHPIMRIYHDSILIPIFR